MIVREVDGTGDWTFGKGRNNYLKNNAAITQNISTRLNSFLGNCFFDLGAGVDWFNLLGSKNVLGLNLAISAVILNTGGVTGIIQLSTSLGENSRQFLVSYSVQTVYSKVSNRFIFDLNAIG